MLPVNSSDEVVEQGNPAEQAVRVLSNLNWARLKRIEGHTGARRAKSGDFGYEFGND